MGGGCGRRILSPAVIQALEEVTGMFPARGDAVLTYLTVTEIDEARGTCPKISFCLIWEPEFQVSPSSVHADMQSKGNKKDFTDVTHSPSVQICSLFSRKENSNLHSS